MQSISVYSVYGLCALSLAAILATTSSAQESDSVDRNYSDELPRIAPLEPADALNSFEVHPGFRMELVAAEPLVRDPIAMAFDEDGRLFVVEMRGYSERRDENIGTVRLLTDDDGDGKYDRATDYVDGLAWPTAVACWDGGVFVGVSPDILYCKDTDGDGQADVREVVFTGFGLSNVQGLLNSFQWGPDNRIHGATSSSGASVVSDSNPIGTPLSLRGRDFSIDPLMREIFPTSGGGQHGLTFDRWGNKFVCQNSNHCQFVAYEDRYIARNPYQRAPAANINIASDGSAADVFRISDVEPWRIVRTRLRVKGLVPGPVEGGGTAAGYFTSATGITAYKGNAWPKVYRGDLFIGDVGSNLIHRKRVTWDGIIPVADRADAKTEFVRSRDVWFRPVQFCNGPDGALYVADMYREVIEHPDSLHPVIKQHLDLNSGFDRGRIYRIVPEDFEQPNVPKLGHVTTGELVILLANPNAWHQETASRLLYQRQSPNTVALLRSIARGSPIPFGRASALTALNGLDALHPEDLLPHFQAADPRMRALVIRLAEDETSHPAIAAQLASLVNDPDARVRYQLAFSLGVIPNVSKAEPLAALAKRDGADSWMRLAIESSAVGVAETVLLSLISDDAFVRQPEAVTVMKMLAGVAGATGSSKGLNNLFALIGGSSDVHEAVSTTIIGAARDAGRGGILREAIASNAAMQENMNTMIARARSMAQDGDTKVEQRVDAVKTITIDSYAESGEALTALLSPGEPQPLQMAALRAFRQYDNSEVAQDVIAKWAGLSPVLRAEAIELLLLREHWALACLNAIQDGVVERAGFDSTHVARLQNHPADTVRELAHRVFEAGSTAEREAVVARYQPALNMEGNLERGKAFFGENCAACHRFGNVGNDVGPSLSGFAQGGPEKIIVNVLDPNREVNPQYLSYTVETYDFEMFSGVVASETATSVTLKRANGVADTILRINIDRMQSEGRSLMPEGWEDAIDVQGMADLIAYLQTAQ